MLSRLLCCGAIAITVLHASSFVAAAKSSFAEVKDDECVVLPEKDLALLSTTWQKYQGFVKICGLSKKGSKPVISLISVWSHDYLDANRKSNWESFPLPILVDAQFRHLGTLPELFPTSYVNSVYVSYGRWRSGIPTEIRVDVADPTVSGDYYYAPLLWDDTEKKYKIKNGEPMPGKRLGR